MQTRQLCQSCHPTQALSRGVHKMREKTPPRITRISLIRFISMPSGGIGYRFIGTRMGDQQRRMASSINVLHPGECERRLGLRAYLHNNSQHFKIFIVWVPRRDSMDRVFRDDGLDHHQLQDKMAQTPDFSSTVMTPLTEIRMRILVDFTVATPFLRKEAPDFC